MKEEKTTDHWPIYEWYRIFDSHTLEEMFARAALPACIMVHLLLYTVWQGSSGALAWRRNSTDDLTLLVSLGTILVMHYCEPAKYSTFNRN